MRRFIATAFLALTSSPALACGADTDCEIADRTYRIMMPDAVAQGEKIGAIVFSHGYRGTAAGIMRNKSFLRLANELGVAVIATKSGGDDWDLPGAPRKPNEDGAAEFAYFDAVIADATRRFPIDRSRLMASGFSAGGMMTWNLACSRSTLFAGFAPVSGTFWQPEPTSCTTPPANIIHFHGAADRTVPLAGRPIADTHQGVVANVLEMYAQYGEYGGVSTDTPLDLSCETRVNPDNNILKFCLFEGGHSFRTKYVQWAWEQFEEAGIL